VIAFRKIVLILGCIIAPFGLALGQEAYIITGKLKVETGRLTQGKILVEKNGKKDKQFSAEGNGKFELKLDLNNNYVISFSQEGYVTKKISFDTHVPKDREEFGFDPFDFQVIIFKQYDDISTVVFNQPVGQIRFDGEIDDFDYDKDYSKSILKEIEEVEKLVKKKEEEEEKKEKEREKEKKEEKEEEPPEKKEEIVQQEAPLPRTVGPKISTAPRPRTFSAPKNDAEGRVIVLQSYTIGEFSYPNLSAYGYINFGDGAGNREISKEQFEKYAQQYR
jgi:hypothetical protein